MDAKKSYTRPELKSQKIELGVFGNYGDDTSREDTNSGPQLFQVLDGRGK